MAKQKVEGKDAQTKAKDGPKILGESHHYRIKKYGLYRYQLIRTDHTNGNETNLGPENVYAVVASDLVDRVFFDINPSNK